MFRHRKKNLGYQFDQTLYIYHKRNKVNQYMVSIFFLWIAGSDGPPPITFTYYSLLWFIESRESCLNVPFCHQIQLHLTKRRSQCTGTPCSFGFGFFIVQINNICNETCLANMKNARPLEWLVGQWCCQHAATLGILFSVRPRPPWSSVLHRFHVRIHGDRFLQT